MHPIRLQRRNGSHTLLGRAVGAFAALLLGVLIYLGSAPEAHERLHSDACCGDHSCVVTAYAAGEGLLLLPFVEIRPLSVRVWQVVRADSRELPASPDFRHLPACGPPSRA